MAPKIGLIVVALGAIPLLFAIMPILSPILGAVFDFTSLLLTSDSGNLSVNAILPWFVVSFVVAAGAIIVLGSGRAFGQIKRGP